MLFKPVASVDMLWIGEMLGVSVEGKSVLLLNADGQVRAYENRCPHLGLELSDGELSGSRPVCRGRQWEYNASTGSGINPATVQLRSIPVLVEDGEILIDLDSLERA